MREAENAIEEAAFVGRAGGRAVRRSGEPHGTPEGRPSRIDPNDDDETRRSLHRENETAAFLADRGWRIQQNPTASQVADARQATGDTGDPKRHPDFLLEGHVFDCYAPGPTKSVRGVWFETHEKIVVKEQTQRVVLDLTDWRGDLDALRRQFADWPIPGSKEVKVVTRDGDIVQMELNQGDA